MAHFPVDLVGGVVAAQQHFVHAPHHDVHPAFAVPFYEHGLTESVDAKSYLQEYVDSSHKTSHDIVLSMLDFAIANMQIANQYI